MYTKTLTVLAAAIGVSASIAAAGETSLTRTFSHNAGGSYTGDAAGLAAQATFTARGSRLNITLRNTSTALPAGVGVSDVLLSSLAFNMPDSVGIRTGARAMLGEDARGHGDWNSRRRYSSASDNWMWSEGGLNDDLSEHTHGISTDADMGEGQAHNFGFGKVKQKDIGDAFGGLISGETASLFQFSGDQMAVENSLVFSFTLNSRLSADALAVIANSAVVEFGDNFKYLQPGAPANSLPAIPLPSAAGMGLLGVIGLVAVRRRTAR